MGDSWEDDDFEVLVATWLFKIAFTLLLLIQIPVLAAAAAAVSLATPKAWDEEDESAALTPAPVIPSAAMVLDHQLTFYFFNEIIVVYRLRMLRRKQVPMKRGLTINSNMSSVYTFLCIFLCCDFVDFQFRGKRNIF